MIKLKVNKDRYEVVSSYLKCNNENIDERINNALKDALDYDKKCFLKYKDSAIVKELTTQNSIQKYKFKIGNLVKVYNLSFPEALKVYRALKVMGYVNMEYKEEGVEIPFEIKEDLINECNELFGERSLGFINSISKEIINDIFRLEATDLSFYDNDENLQDLIAHTPDLSKLTIAKIQRECGAGFIKAKQILKYIHDKYLS